MFILCVLVVYRGLCVHDLMVGGFKLILCWQCLVVLMFVSFITSLDVVYLIQLDELSTQLYVVKFVSYMWQVDGFLQTTNTWLCKLQKRCTRFAAASDKVYQLLACPWSVVLSGYSGFFHH